MGDAVWDEATCLSSLVGGRVSVSKVEACWGDETKECPESDVNVPLQLAIVDAATYGVFSACWKSVSGVSSSSFSGNEAALPSSKASKGVATPTGESFPAEGGGGDCGRLGSTTGDRIPDD